MLSENALRCQFQLGKIILKLRLSSLSLELTQVKQAKFQVSKQILLHPLTERVLCVQQALDTVTDGKSSSCYNHREPQRTSHPIIPTGQWEVDTGSKKAEWNKEMSRGLSQRSSGWGKDNNTRLSTFMHSTICTESMPANKPTVLESRDRQMKALAHNATLVLLKKIIEKSLYYMESPQISWKA